MKNSNINDCGLINFNIVKDKLGNNIDFENKLTIPFDIKRIYYLYDVPQGAERGGHAHKELYQLIFALSGSFTIDIDDSTKKKSFFLNSPSQGLLIVPGIWRELVNFSHGSICLVLASELYIEDDYFRNYSEFSSMKKSY